MEYYFTKKNTKKVVPYVDSMFFKLLLLWLASQQEIWNV